MIVLSPSTSGYRRDLLVAFGGRAVSRSRPSALRTDLAVGVPLSEGFVIVLRLLTPVAHGRCNAALRRPASRGGSELSFIHSPSRHLLHRSRRTRWNPS